MFSLLPSWNPQLKPVPPLKGFGRLPDDVNYKCDICIEQNEASYEQDGLNWCETCANQAQENNDGV